MRVSSPVSPSNDLSNIARNKLRLKVQRHQKLYQTSSLVVIEGDTNQGSVRYNSGLSARSGSKKAYDKVVLASFD